MTVQTPAAANVNKILPHVFQKPRLGWYKKNYMKESGEKHTISASKVAYSHNVSVKNTITPYVNESIHTVQKSLYCDLGVMHHMMPQTNAAQQKVNVSAGAL